MSDIKMILISTGSDLKKIVGEFERYEYDDSVGGSRSLVFSNAIMLAELMLEKGIKVVPMPLAPKDERDKFRIDDRFVVVKPFTPEADVINLYTRITSKLVVL